MIEKDKILYPKLYPKLKKKIDKSTQIFFSDYI